MPAPISILQGTLDLMILRTLATLGPRHAYAIATRLEQVSDELLKVNQGTLYPALVRLEQNGWIKGSWGKTETNREAKYYSVTRLGLKAMEDETQRWRQITGVMDRLLAEES
ncbi:MAG TPA: PadR family transcriptional regulator [Terracidiphilus sp.]|nr:PadR family transcriptional regulator [Terracidiphilus sp.]